MLLAREQQIAPVCVLPGPCFRPAAAPSSPPCWLPAFLTSSRVSHYRLTAHLRQALDNITPRTNITAYILAVQRDKGLHCCFLIEPFAKITVDPHSVARNNTKRPHVPSTQLGATLLICRKRNTDQPPGLGPALLTRLTGGHGLNGHVTVIRYFTRATESRRVVGTGGLKMFNLEYDFNFTV